MMNSKQKIADSAKTMMRDVCGLKKNERVLIITNPDSDVFEISRALYSASTELGGIPVLMVQPVKTLLDTAEDSVVEAIKSTPDIVLSISENKLGKDKKAMENPYVLDGRTFDSTFDYLLDGVKKIRAVWTPGITIDMFCRTTCIDYALLSTRCVRLCSRFENAESVHVTSPSGTDVYIPVKGRKPYSDDGAFNKPGTGGNIPAGEVYISPIVGGTKGVIAFDGSLSLTPGDIVIKDPIFCNVVDGFVESIYGGKQTEQLLDTIKGAEEKAQKMEQSGVFSKEKAAEYAKNARNIGELGIGLNPAAIIGGNMLEDEKALHTCHFAIGMNYDGDAPSFIHLDGVIKNPTIVITYSDGSQFTVEENGELSPELMA